MIDDEARSLTAEGLAEVSAAHRASAPRREIRDRQFAAGLAWVWFPEGLGGLGASPELQAEVDEALSADGLPPFEETSGIGIGMTA